ncbi:hypothetical protein CR513_21575, partial [Mucuna pruriens]
MGLDDYLQKPVGVNAGSLLQGKKVRCRPRRHWPSGIGHIVYTVYYRGSRLDPANWSTPKSHLRVELPQGSVRPSSPRKSRKPNDRAWRCHKRLMVDKRSQQRIGANGTSKWDVGDEKTRFEEAWLCRNRCKAEYIECISNKRCNNLKG